MISPLLRVVAFISIVPAFACLNLFAVGPSPRDAGPGVSTPAPTRAPTATSSTTPAGMINEKLFNGIQWRQIGPFRGGRALAIEGVIGEPDTYYFGAVAGGGWKTVDGGANLTPLFDNEEISSIGAIAVAPSDHNVIYAGTGEATIRRNTTYRTRAVQSADARKT